MELEDYPLPLPNPPMIWSPVSQKLKKKPLVVYKMITHEYLAVTEVQANCYSILIFNGYPNEAGVNTVPLFTAN